MQSRTLVHGIDPPMTLVHGMARPILSMGFLTSVKLIKITLYKRNPESLTYSRSSIIGMPRLVS